MTLNWITDPCPNPDEASRDAAQSRQSVLTKPPGSLGALEQLATDFAAWQASEKPKLERIIIRIFAADHGVCAQGVSAFPQQVTAQMVHNFIDGGAAISVLAKDLDADFAVINLGTVGQMSDAPRLLNVQIANGTADFTQAPAMTEPEMARAMNVGRDQVAKGELFIGGEMGIGNTTSASAIYACMLGLPATQTVGPGTGVDHQGQARKAKVIEQAVARHAVNIKQPLEVLRHLGGFEIAALVGAYISAAQQRIPILVDGFICTAAALLAVNINPDCRRWMLFAHTSAEPAHMDALVALNATPMLNLGMRLGEGSGAAVAVPILKSALLLHSNMATFADAGVSDSVT